MVILNGSQPGIGEGRLSGRAFTLVEVLVVISVIGVLLAILLPALGAARRSADIILCQHRLASIGKMYYQYGNDHGGLFPTHKYPLDKQGIADPIFIPEWGEGGGGWLILPISEITFWAHPLRSYAADDPDGAILKTVEQLSCPVVHRAWLRSLPPREREGGVKDPMASPQRSYWQSTALFTQWGVWRDSVDPPDVNAVHTTVRLADAAYPANKTLLVEAAAHHHESAPALNAASWERFNTLAVDGHVERLRAAGSLEPVGFVGDRTGFEQPPRRRDEWASSGVWLISTREGIHGRDW